MYPKPCSFQTSRQEGGHETHRRTAAPPFDWHYYKHDSAFYDSAIRFRRKCAHATIATCHINSEKERIAELYTFTKWEDDNPSVLVAAAQTLARYHALAVPHPASKMNIFQFQKS